MEVDLFRSQLKEIAKYSFSHCESLQAVRLPSSLESIGHRAFWNCYSLTKVEVATGNPAINIDREAFEECDALANFVIPQESTVDETAFKECILLHRHLGEAHSDVVHGLVHRFDEHPVHKQCYHSSTATVQELSRLILDQDEDQTPIDQFGMSPFHQLFSSVRPRQDLLEVLLDNYPAHILGLIDQNEDRAMDFVIVNWTAETKTMLQMSLQRWAINRLETWGIALWRDTMTLKMNTLLSEVDTGQRKNFVGGILRFNGRL